MIVRREQLLTEDFVIGKKVYILLTTDDRRDMQTLLQRRLLTNTSDNKDYRKYCQRL